jgi:LPXTG-motif cell wall-anchored protein
MVTVLTLIGVAILAGLLVVSVKRQRELGVAKAEARAAARNPDAEAQHERSLRERDRVRAAHADERLSRATDTGQEVGSDSAQ